eukprot:gene18059-21571_t
MGSEDHQKKVKGLRSMLAHKREADRLAKEFDETTDSREEQIARELLELIDKKVLEQSEYSEEEMKNINMQTELELEVTAKARENYRSLVSDTSAVRKSSGLRPIKSVLIPWYNPLIAHLTVAVTSLRKGQPIDHIDDPFTADTVLTEMPVKQMALIALNTLMSELLSGTTPGECTVARAVQNIGGDILVEHRVAVLKRTDRVAYKRLMTPYGSNAPPSLRAIANTVRKTYRREDDKVVTDKIGGFLLRAIMEACIIPKYSTEGCSEMIPAFFYDYKYTARGKTGYVVVHQSILKQIDEGHILQEAMNANLLPMVIKPNPWTSPTDGCYLQYPVFIMRTHGSKQQISSLSNADLDNIYEGLNALGEVPWKINKKLLTILLAAWEKGDPIGDIPGRYDYEKPEAPEDILTSMKSRREHTRKLNKIKQMNADLHSMRCDTLYKLNVGQQFQDLTFYFPHNVDFRGRSYPIPPHLNHLGSDFCRSMLKFAESKPLGARGLDWLRVQVANLFGVDKISFEDRINFTNEHMEQITDSAINPLDGKRWWLKADYPWQTLAACIELNEALTSPDPTAFMSNLPVHQDGTCNGLQHYTALGGDKMGALKVNLLPSPRPQDVYSGVAAIVASSVAEDARNGDLIAKELDGKIERKIVKQTVMTSVYGVTFIGARNQIQNALEEKHSFDDDFMFKASNYLAKETFASLDKTFSGARSIMAWLAKAASSISKTGECVAWLTPLGLPVVQPYRKGGRFQVKTLGQAHLLIDEEDQLPVDSRKQSTAFPPNYIHSLDSTHMFLTAIQCKKDNITFASVHDSFWTHASTIDDMNVVLRNQFVDLHSQPLLERLRDYFVEKYPTAVIPPLPKKGDLDLSQVRDSKYFFH